MTPVAPRWKWARPGVACRSGRLVGAPQREEADIFENPSLVTRVAIGKMVGLVFGLVGFIAIPYVWAEAGWLVRWGTLLWYPTLGGIVGLVGVMTWHPVVKIRMPWWLRGSLVGAWMNFVLTFFAYDTLAGFMTSGLGQRGLLASPFWFVLEGAIVGLIIGFFATRYGGEGRETVADQP